MIYSIIESSSEEIRIQKTGHKYILFVDGKQASILYCDDYNQEGFNWALISNVYTEEEYRGHGYARMLIAEAYKDIKKKYNGKVGLYCFVLPDNKSAIKLYKKCNFVEIMHYNIDGTDYIIMGTKANKNNFKQFEGRKFYD